MLEKILKWTEGQQAILRIKNRFWWDLQAGINLHKFGYLHKFHNFSHAFLVNSPKNPFPFNFF